MTNTKLVIYDIKMNPFRTERGIVKLDNNGNLFNLNDQVVVLINRETLIGNIIKIKELAHIQHPISNIQYPISNMTICRKVNEADLLKKTAIDRKNKETKEFFEDLLKKFKIVGKVVLIDWDFNHHKVYCYITSERKINYLLLHETAVDTLKTRVAIKQIGIRDYARSISGLGICGRELCCRVFLNNIQSVTLSMARQQNLYVEPEKISGCCGKLRCCIGFETYNRKSD